MRLTWKPIEITMVLYSIFFKYSNHNEKNIKSSPVNYKGLTETHKNWETW